MLTLSAGNTIQGDAGTATAVTYTISGMELASGAETYKVLAQGQLPASVAALYTVGAGTTAFVKSIILANATASPVTGITLFINGTAAANQILPAISLPAYGMAIIDDNGLKVYDGSGSIYTTYIGSLFDSTLPARDSYIAGITGSSLFAAHRDHRHQAPGGMVSTIANSAAINTTDSAIVQANLPADLMNAYTTFRVIASGTCTSSAANASNFRLRIGTAGTNADAIAAVLTPTGATSGTNIPFRVEFLVTVRTNGASGTALGSGVLWNNGILGVSSSAYPVVSQVTSPITVNTTVQNWLTLFYLSAATTTTSTFYNAVMELVSF